MRINMQHRSVDSLQETDILIVGGGMSGLMAAMAAKDEHNRVLIVEASNVLGGQGTTGGVAGFCGDTQRVNDIFHELVDKLARNQFIAEYHPNADRREYDLEWCAFFLQEMVLDRNIDILLHSRVTDATVADGRINRVRIATAGEELICRPKFVIDATGINIVVSRAGFPLVNEGANKQLPMSLYFTLWNTGKKVQPVLPPGCPQWSGEENIPMTSLHYFPSGKVEVKMKVVGFDAADGVSLSQAELFARRQMAGLIYFLQTRGYKGNVLDTYTLASVSRAIGVREQKRLKGEHVLTYDEVKRGCVFEDGVAVGTYHTDFHWPDKLQRAGTGIVEMLEPYQIPLRSFIPRGAKNVLVSGRGISAEQMALSSFRVMATVAQIGFAAGKAAKQCTDRGVFINEIDLPRLKKDINAGGQSLDLSHYGEYLREMLFFHEDVFDLPQLFQQCHASTIVQLQNNRFLVAWFAGTAEGHPDTGIWLAERYQATWSLPSLVAKVNDRPHWNPVLFKTDKDHVMLSFKVGPSPQEWTTWLTVSEDQGKTWKDPVRLENHSDKSPVGPVKNKPIILSDGTWVAPNSIESKETWDAFVDISTDQGQTWKQSEKVPLDHAGFQGQGVIQPTVWESKVNHVHMLLRSTCGHVCRSDSEDGGRTWSPLKMLSLPNNNSGLDVVKLQRDVLALVFNPVNQNWGARTPLRIALSTDNGQTWPHQQDIETGKGEFSYPSVISTETGLAIVYTYNRQKIKFWHGSIERVLSDYQLEKLRDEIFNGIKRL
ncbi:FAD-dependent oxidoreductase [candidate division KSB1 bacterium]|nr:FAD-dependent oxidoreductase [candidate division KSB1 bacterium]